MDTTAFPHDPQSQGVWPDSDTRVLNAPPPMSAPFDGFAPPAATPPGLTPPTQPPVPPVIPSTPAKGRGNGGKIVAGAALAALLAGGIGGYVGTQAANHGGSITSSLTQSSTANASLSAPASGSIAAVAAAVSPSVVKITASDGNGGGGTGTGFIIRSDGYILTNNHVGGTGTLTVQFADGTKVPAKLVGANQQYDVAVIKVDKTDLPATKLGKSYTVHVGDTAIAIGSPLGLEETVTAGIISALNRPVTAGGESGGETSFINAIQTDAPINPGNSGGPLLNASGEVIGINSAIASLGSSGGGQSGSIGLGFAIPIDTAARLADEIISTGKSTTPIVGVKLDTNASTATISEVTAGGPGDKAGLKAGDVVTKVDGRPVSDSTEFIVAVRSHAPGDTVTLTVQSGGQTSDVQLTLGSQ